MKFIYTLILCLIAFPVTAQNTMPYLDGVPVMNNFALSDDDVLVFDKPEGRVIDITTWCATNCPTDKVIDTFYMSTLNRLGWTMTAPRQFSNNQTLIQYDIVRDTSENSVIILFRSNG
jgi:hypothetical protein